MTVFLHHIYEYQKGLRNLVLYTGPQHEKPHIIKKLNDFGINYLIVPLGNQRINVFFGHTDCVETVRSFKKDNLSRFTPEEDFLLGIMLGYDRVAQCTRYLKRLEQSQRQIS